MKINSFKAKGVHGYLNYDIHFFPNLTFLLGINGSGKTTALKLILGMVSPSYQYLNQIVFTEAELICSSIEEERDISITAKHNRTENTFSINLRRMNTNVDSDPFPRFIRTDDDGTDAEEMSLREQAHREKFDTSDVVKSIRQLATPKFLGLDRRIYEGRQIDSRISRRHFIARKRRKSLDPYSGNTALDSSLEEAQYLIFDYLRTIAYKQPQISEEFKKKVFQLSFNFVEDHNVTTLPTDSVAISKKETEVLDALKGLDINYLDYQVKGFFRKLIEIIDQNRQLQLPNQEKSVEGTVSNEQLKIYRKWFNNSSQLRQIEEIIKYSQNYQQEIAKLRSPILKLEDLTSNFFKEGRKRIQVKSDGELNVIFESGKHASVYELSSGEKQILIMIAHLIFEEDQKPSGVFIIDEPELSLHIAWQEIFVDAIMKASPKTQFILATHSPSIISKVDREAFCQDLARLNS